MSSRLRDANSIPLEAIDVSDPQLYADDTWAPFFARLRWEAPVHYCSKSAYGPYWSVTRYDDIMAVELDYATFSSSSEHGGIQIAASLLGPCPLQESVGWPRRVRSSPSIEPA